MLLSTVNERHPSITIDMAMQSTSSAPSFTESTCCDSILSTPEVQLDPSARSPLFPVDAEDGVLQQQRRLSLDSGLCDQDDICTEEGEAEEIKTESRHASVSSSSQSTETLAEIGLANVDSEKDKLKTVSQDDRP